MSDTEKQEFQRRYGTRDEVFAGSAEKTRGGLKKADLLINSRTGRIVSKKKSEQARKNYLEHGFRKREKVDEKPKKRRRKKKADK